MQRRAENRSTKRNSLHREPQPNTSQASHSSIKLLIIGDKTAVPALQQGSYSQPSWPWRSDWQSLLMLDCPEQLLTHADKRASRALSRGSNLTQSRTAVVKGTDVELSRIACLDTHFISVRMTADMRVLNIRRGSLGTQLGFLH